MFFRMLDFIARVTYLVRGIVFPFIIWFYGSSVVIIRGWVVVLAIDVKIL
jgi:hypothetical protein